MASTVKPVSAGKPRVLLGFAVGAVLSVAAGYYFGKNGLEGPKAPDVTPEQQVPVSPAPWL